MTICEGGGKQKRSLRRKTSGMDSTDHAKRLNLAEQSRDENLPEEMIKHIISKMPFPSLFKTKLLSKVWNDKLLLSCDSARSSVILFQKELTMMSTNWTTYSPVFVNKGGIRGFHRPSSEWKSLFSFSYLPVPDWSCIQSPSSVGSLICVAPNDYRDPVFVTNVLTKTWKAVLVPSDLGDAFKFLDHRRDHVKLLPGDSDTFKLLLLFTFEEGSDVSTVLYDSGLNKWETKMSCIPAAFYIDFTVDTYLHHVFPASVYLGGKLYCMIGDRLGDPKGLWIHHVDTNFAWEPIIRDGLVSKFKQVAADGGVLLCGQKIMVVFWWKKLPKRMWKAAHDQRVLLESISPEYIFFPLRYEIKICELDLDLLRLVKVCIRLPGLLGLCSSVGSCQPKPFGYKWCNPWKYNGKEWACVKKENIRCASDDDFIYFFQMDIPGKPILTYNVHNRNWGSLPPPGGWRDITDSLWKKYQ